MATDKRYKTIIGAALVAAFLGAGVGIFGASTFGGDEEADARTQTTEQQNADQASQDAPDQQDATGEGSQSDAGANAEEPQDSQDTPDEGDGAEEPAPEAEEPEGEEPGDTPDPKFDPDLPLKDPGGVIDPDPPAPDMPDDLVAPEEDDDPKPPIVGPNKIAKP